jgi:hypothetical protein
VRTPHSDWSPSCGQGDPGWTPSRIQFGKTCGLTFLRRNAVEKIPWNGLLTSVQPRIIRHLAHILGGGQRRVNKGIFLKGSH